MKISIERFRLGCLLALATFGVQVSASQHVWAARLDDIRARGYLVVAVKDNVRPLGFRDSDGQLRGLEIDIAHRLAEELLGADGRAVLQPVSNAERLSVLLTDEVDVVIAQMTATASRSRVAAFSPPYYLDGTAFVTRNPAIRSVLDLGRHSVAVLDGSTSIDNLRFLLPQVRLVGVRSYQEAYNQLESDHAIAFAADASILSGWVQEYPGYRLLPTVLSAQALCIAMPKGVQYDDLRRHVHGAIARWQGEGWLQERIEYWGLPD